MKKEIVINYTSVVLLRVFVSGIFLVAGFNHFYAVEKTAARLEAAKFGQLALAFGPAEVLVMLTGAIMLTAGTAFLLGFKTKWAAMVLLAVLVPITLTIQAGQMATLGPLFKNIAIAGGLLFFMLNDISKPLKFANYEIDKV